MANPTIGFIGYGNMAQAIAEGLVNAGVVNVLYGKQGDCFVL